MSRDLSTTALQSIYDQETSEVWVVLLEITHPDLAETVYLSSDPTTTLADGNYGTESNGNDYVFLPFRFFLQPQTENLLARAKIRIDNVSRDLIRSVLDAQNEPPEVDVKVVLASAPDTIEFQISNLLMDNVRASATELEADLFPKILQGEQFPFETFSVADFPGLYGGL